MTSKLKLVYSPASRSSAQEIYKYIAKDNIAAANKQIQKIYNTIELIQNNPYIGVVGRVENTREFFIPNANYFIVYTITTTSINIVNIIHTAKYY